MFGNFRTRNLLQAYCELTMNVQALGTNSTLQYSATNPKFSFSYQDCTFESFTMDEGSSPCARNNATMFANT